MRMRHHMADLTAKVVTLEPWIRFSRSLKRPRRKQIQRLKKILSMNADSAYGVQHGFREILDSGEFLSDYQRRVPMVHYEDIDSWIQRIAAGEKSILCTEPVLSFERSSGSTGASKMIPMTASLLKEFQAGINPWLHDMERRHAGLKGTSAYWSISTLAKEPEKTSGGIPVGIPDDTAYFGKAMAWAIRERLAVPGLVACLPDMDSCRYVTNAMLLADETLGFFSVWSPTFLTILMDCLHNDLDSLIADIQEGQLRPPRPLPDGVSFPWKANPKRAEFLRSHAIINGRLNTEAIWPRLTLISCWASASSEPFIPQVKSLFPSVKLEGKGLLATEGILSVPWGEHKDCVLCPESHFMEFLDIEKPDAAPCLIDDLELGRTYEVIMSTGGGLYRYRIGDLLKVSGFEHKTPRVIFAGRRDQRVDICGEKLNSTFVREVLAEVSADLSVQPIFSMLSPELGEPSRYLLFLEGERIRVETFSKAVELKLRQNHHYHQCRRLGQLGPVEGVIVNNAVSKYESHLLSNGIRAGDIKPVDLHAGLNWRQIMNPVHEK